MKVIGRLIFLVFFGLVAAGCNQNTEATTTTAPPSVTQVGGGSTSTGIATTTTAPDEPTGTTPSVAAPDPIEFEVRYRSQKDDGDLLVVLVPAGEYDDRALEGVLFNILDAYPTASDVRVIDDIAALQAVLTDDADLVDEDRSLRDAHYLVELANGVRIVFHGPFADLGSYSFGS